MMGDLCLKMLLTTYPTAVLSSHVRSSLLDAAGSISSRSRVAVTWTAMWTGSVLIPDICTMTYERTSVRDSSSDFEVVVRIHSLIRNAYSQCNQSEEGLVPPLLPRSRPLCPRQTNTPDAMHASLMRNRREGRVERGQNGGPYA